MTDTEDTMQTTEMFDDDLACALRLVGACPLNDQDVYDLPREQLPLLIVKLTRLQTIAAERLALGELPEPEPPADGDALLDADETAAYIRRSISWVRRHGNTKLAGALRQPGGKGTATRWSRAALATWLKSADRR
jgi:hypothetical protein